MNKTLLPNQLSKEELVAKREHRMRKSRKKTQEGERKMEDSERGNVIKRRQNLSPPN